MNPDARWILVALSAALPGGAFAGDPLDRVSGTEGWKGEARAPAPPSKGLRALRAQLELDGTTDERPADLAAFEREQREFALDRDAQERIALSRPPASDDERLPGEAPQAPRGAPSPEPAARPGAGAAPSRRRAPRAGQPSASSRAAASDTAPSGR